MDYHGLADYRLAQYVRKQQLCSYAAACVPKAHRPTNRRSTDQLHELIGSDIPSATLMVSTRKNNARHWNLRFRSKTTVKPNKPVKCSPLGVDVACDILTSGFEIKTCSARDIFSQAMQRIGNTLLNLRARTHARRTEKLGQRCININMLSNMAVAVRITLPQTNMEPEN